MKTQSLSLNHTIADFYNRDALDFASRFDLMWDASHLMHKSGRIKSFLDLVLACECALKCQVFLTNLNLQPKEVYCRIRKCSHDINKLADYAINQRKSACVDLLKSRLSSFPIKLRYSLDSSEAFFPSYMERKDADLDYTGTLGNTLWVREIREALRQLIESAADELSGIVTSDLTALVEHEKQMKEFADECLNN